MKAFTSIFGREKRTRSTTDGPRKRPIWSFSSSFATLERRALLAAVGPGTMSTASVMVVAQSSPAAPDPGTPAIQVDPPDPTDQAIAVPAPIMMSTTSAMVVARSNPAGADQGMSAIQVATTSVTNVTPSYLAAPDPGMSATQVAPSTTSGQIIGGPTLPNPNPPGWLPGQDFGSSSGTVAGKVADGNPTVSGPVGPISEPPHDRLKDHVALAEADISINGTMTPELAFADAGENKVFVKIVHVAWLKEGIDSANAGVSKVAARVSLGGPTVVLGASDGINHPQSVTLQDVNGDGIPDLIVANSGSNNILVFPGLPGGLFGPEINGGKGFAVGQDPVSVTVGDVNHDGNTDLIVANRSSNSVTILDGQGVGAGWTATVGETIAIGTPAMNTAPVKTVLIDINHDGSADLVVCNSGSNNVYLYKKAGNGNFDTANPTVFNVGINPSEMLIGRFDNRPQLDLITINEGSDNLTFIGGVFTSHPTTTSYSSGGTMPDAAFAVDPTHSGVMDLVVANGGDGHMALLKAGPDGLQVAGVITQSNVPIPTALAPVSWSNSGIDFFAASAGEDAAQLLHFDLGTASTFLPAPLDESGSNGEAKGELFAQLMPFGDSGMELIAVFWAGSPESMAISGEWGLRESSTITALYTPTEGQGADDSTPTVDVSHAPGPPSIIPADPSKVDPTLWAKFVFGLDSALGEPRSLVVEAIAARDARETGDERPIDELAQLDRRPLDQALDPELEAASGAIDEALRLFWSEGRPTDGIDPVEPSPTFDSTRPLDGIDAPATQGNLETVPLISSALVLSARLILKASPPRPPSFRNGATRRGVPGTTTN